MGALSWLIPQEAQFFDMIDKQSLNVIKGVNALVDMLEDYTNLEEKRKAIRKIEKDGDIMVHDIYAELNKTFITPIDREDISAIISSLDDILDLVEAVSESMVIFKVAKPTEYMIRFARTLQHAAEEVHEAISMLRNFKDAQKIRACCKNVNTRENEGDVLHREAMGALFDSNDAILIIKLKELYDDLEDAIDKCEDAADVIGDILVKYT